MSGQWEVVGKKKDKNSKQVPQKLNKDTKKKTVINGPKVEDILPESQVKNLYASNKSNKENQKPQDKSKKQESNPKKPQKKPEKQQQEAPKPKPPKSIESALNSLSVEDFKNDFEQVKTLFPDGPVIWLKHLAQYLNLKVFLDVPDPVFTNKGECYPFSVIPSSIRNVMDKAIKEAGPENSLLFYDISLTAMATDMGKGLSALGHKFFIQILAHTDPKIVTASLSKHIVLRNSYQNRQAIGLSILWGLGQGGIKNFNVGFKVFQDVMLPLLEMKNYSRYVVTYLVDLINRFNDVPLTKEQYLLIMDIVYGNKKNFPLDLTNSLYNIVPKLKVLLFTSNNDKYYSFIEPILKKLGSNNNKVYESELCDVLVTCLQKDQASLGTWSEFYVKDLTASAILLNYIDKNWGTVSKKLNKRVFRDILKTYSVTNEELLTKKKKDEGVSEAVEAIKKLSNKMAAKKSSGFPLKTSVVLLALTIGTVVYYDISVHGSWKKSKTLKLLIDSGACEYSNKAANGAKESVFWMQQRVDEKFPGFSGRVVEFTGPYVQLTRELSLVFYNSFHDVKNSALAKYPAFIESVEGYAPGLIEQSQKTFQNVWSSSIVYYNRSVDYLKKEIFVGQLAPENMHRVVMDALNTTQQKASEYYLWLYEKVQRTIK